MSISPASSPHTTLTPLEAAQLSVRTKEAVNSAVQQHPDEENGNHGMPSQSALSPRSEEETNTLEHFLTPAGSSTLHRSDLVSHHSNNVSKNNENDNNTVATCNIEPIKEQMLEDRVAHLEERLASLTEICHGLLLKQQQQQEQEVRKINVFA